MTITDATHALARAWPGDVHPPPGARLRLVDAMARVEPTWVEAVAVVQAVCAQLPDGHAAPALDALMLEPDGRVSFAPTASSDAATAVSGAGRLLSSILCTGDCPMPVWEATERARRAPRRVGSAHAFGASLTCFPAAQGARELARYYEIARRSATPMARLATASFSTSALTAPAGLVLVALLLGGVGAGAPTATPVAPRVAAPGFAPTPLSLPR